MDDNRNLAALTLDYIHKKTPLFSYQVEILKYLFDKSNPMRILMLNCGRKFSKTHISIYFLIRSALENKNATYYYVAPDAVQGKEIVWTRLKSFCPKSLSVGGKAYKISDYKDTTLEVTFFNGSRIKLVGSTGVSAESLRGCEPHGVVYDEYKDHDPRFHESMNPNFSVHDAKLLIIGTPPSMEDIESGDKRFYQDMIDYCEKFDDCIVFSRSSLENPIENIRKWVTREKERLFSLGKSGIAIWEREYEGKLVYGGSVDFLPQFSKKDLVHPAIVEDIIFREYFDMDFSVFFDPGGGTRWGALFFAYNLNTSTLYVLDKISLRSKNAADVENMTHEKLFNMTMDKLSILSPPKVHPKSWKFFYDSANSEFKLNVSNKHRDVLLQPVNKNRFGKLEGFSQIKDLKNSNRLVISEKAEELIDEFLALKIDRNGIPIKKFNELSDCLRYRIFELDHVLRTKEAEADIPFDRERYFENAVESFRNRPLVNSYEFDDFVTDD